VACSGPAAPLRQFKPDVSGAAQPGWIKRDSRYLVMGSTAVSRTVRLDELILVDKSSKRQKLEEKLGY
jgi:hypothetical protein